MEQRGGSRNHRLYLLRVSTFYFPRIDGCRYVIVFMACGHLKVRESCIWIQNGIDLFVRPARSGATIYVVSNDMFRSTRLPRQLYLVLNCVNHTDCRLLLGGRVLGIAAKRKNGR